ncbi:MAG: hypothetical protein JW829_13170 [Pirellulales bacterium]|nr:hypothetical protein [Pirellulales bacterium]
MNAESDDWIDSIDGLTFDYIYSFLAIGFHWSIHFYLDRLRSHCHDNTRLIFGMRGTDRGARFATEQLDGIDPRAYFVELNARDSERLRSSVLVLRPVA